jgi:flagellar hook protein FlgE
MFNAFSTALSALNASSTAIDVVGNNLANLNTTGFKASNVMFYDLVAEAIGTTHQDAGLGTGRPNINAVYSQGAIQTSNGNLDAAIQGDGFLLIIYNE